VPDPGVVHLLVIGAISEQELLVGLEKGATLLPAVVPDQNHPSLGLKDPAEFASCRLGIEPVIGLTGRHQVDGSIRQAGVLSSAVCAGEESVGGQQRFACPSHLDIGLDAIHPTASVQK